MERPQCCIARCLTKTKSIKVKDIIYYLFPTDKDWSDKWERRIKEFDSTFKRKSNDIVCSLHFAKASMKPVSRQLVDHALPIYFPQKVIDSSQPQWKFPTQQAVGNEEKRMESVPDSTLVDENCCIVGCPTKFNDSVPKIHALKFPDDPEQRKKWIFIIELYNNQKIDWEQSMRICALHFGAGCFTKPDQLMEGAKPSVFKHAVARRQMEIAKQQKQAQEPVKVQSINVPLHKSGTTNQSMTRRSASAAPVVARRLSLPFSRLPTLLPKPTAAKRANPTQINGPNGVINVHRINSQNILLASTASGSAMKQGTLRPLPGLNKVVTIANASKPVVRRSMPPPTTANTNSSLNATISTPTLVPVKRTQITRLPPTLKPAPQINAKLRRIEPAFKTCTKTPQATYITTKMPIISKVQGAERIISLENSSTPVTANFTENIHASSQVMEKCASDFMLVEDEEAEIAKAIEYCGESSTAENSAASTSMISSNGTPKNVYVVRNESAFQYPSLLLKRILMNKRKNEELALEAQRRKRMCIKMYQQVRLQRATTTGETIEIS